MGDLRDPWLIFAAALIAAALLIYGGSVFLGRRRTAALTLVAQQMGFSYEHDGTPFEPAPLVTLLTTGRQRKFTHVLRGWTAGMETSLFDYRYTTGRGRNSKTHRQTVAAFRLPRIFVNFRLSTANWADKVSVWFGGQDVTFDAASEFSRRFRLKGRDEPSIRAAFGPASLRYFELLPNDHWVIESGEGWLLLYKAGRKVRPSAMQDFARETSNLTSGFKQAAGMV
ncbi:MAG TPA: hypothetical protein VKW06_08335 [Candidatus Angelobacter sp.]|nr:hypothetical protein [Candidatus Angelobacter sp.]